MRKLFILAALLITLPLPVPGANAQKKKSPLSGYDRSARATVLHDTVVYVAPDDQSQKVAIVTPGHELVVIDHSGPWVKVYANTDAADQVDDKPDFAEEETVTPASGWVRDKGIVTPQTPAGDAILYGTAADLEEQAQHPHGPKNAAAGAHLLYRRVADYYPASPLAGESAFRSADIRWQVDKLDISSLPSAREQEAYLRPQLYEGDMKRIIKLFPNSKYAAAAAYNLIDNKLCGDWQGLPKCPEMESGLYLKYADQYSDSARAAEAMYNAVYRQGVLVAMYKVEDNRKRSESAEGRTQKLAAEMHTRFPNSDFTHRAESIAYRVQQNISIYGNTVD